MLQEFIQCYTIIGRQNARSGRHFKKVLSAIFQQVLTHAASAVLVFVAFYLSLISTSLPPANYDKPVIERAIRVLESKGYEREVFLLRNTVTFRSTDNWLNSFTPKENAYASTNFPFQIVTLYPDFYSKAVDDRERAMIFLHESRHLIGENENQAYAYVWKNRENLGWTLRAYGTTESYVTIEQQTRENAPELFNCPEKPWEDCTER